MLNLVSSRSTKYLTFAWRHVAELQKNRDRNFYRTNASPCTRPPLIPLLRYLTMLLFGNYHLGTSASKFRSAIDENPFLKGSPCMDFFLFSNCYVEDRKEQWEQRREWESAFRKYLLAITKEKSGRYNSDFHQGTFKLPSKDVCSSNGNNRNETPSAKERGWLQDPQGKQTMSNRRVEGYFQRSTYSNEPIDWATKVPFVSFFEWSRSYSPAATSPSELKMMLR